jgi:hypothetical protein
MKNQNYDPEYQDYSIVLLTNSNLMEQSEAVVLDK